MGTTPRLGVIMIVKNEEKNLDNILSDIKNVVDEAFIEEEDGIFRFPRNRIRTGIPSFTIPGGYRPGKTSGLPLSLWIRPTRHPFGAYL